MLTVSIFTLEMICECCHNIFKTNGNAIYPVFAAPIQSAPANICGIQLFWIGVGVFKPAKQIIYFFLVWIRMTNNWIQIIHYLILRFVERSTAQCQVIQMFPTFSLHRNVSKLSKKKFRLVLSHNQNSEWNVHCCEYTTENMACMCFVHLSNDADLRNFEVAVNNCQIVVRFIQRLNTNLLMDGIHEKKKTFIFYERKTIQFVTNK